MQSKDQKVKGSKGQKVKLTDLDMFIPALVYESLDGVLRDDHLTGLILEPVPTLTCTHQTSHILLNE